MSVLVLSWVFANSPTKLGDRLVLLALADYAHDDGSRAFPSVESLAAKARVGKSTARGALRRLEAEGHIVSEGATPSGTTSYRVLMRAPDSGGGQNRAGGAPDSGPNPSKEPSTKKSAGERARAAAQKLPDDFPDALKPHARQVFAVLRDVAEQHNAREVTPRGVGLAIQGHPGRRFVGVAYELASWAQAPPRPINDVVSTYRTFLDKAPTYAGTEPLGRSNGQVVAIDRNAPVSSRELAERFRVANERRQAENEARGIAG